MNQKQVNNNYTLIQTLAVVFMGLAVLLTLFKYEGYISKKHFFGLIPWNHKREISLAPSLVTTIIATILYSSLIVRKIVIFDLTGEQKNIILNIIMTILNIFFIASFLTIFVGGEVWNIVGYDINSKVLLFFAVLFSWASVKAIAGYIWIILFIFAIPHMTDADILTGLYGPIYIVSAFISIGCQLIPNQSFDLFAKMLGNDIKNAANHITQDVHEANEVTKQATKAAINTAANMALKRKARSKSSLNTSQEKIEKS